MEENNNSIYVFILICFFSDCESNKCSMYKVDKDSIEASKIIMSLEVITIKISMYGFHFHMWVYE